MQPSDGLRRLYEGDFNVMSQEWQADGSVIVRIHRHADDQAVELHLADLYGPNEKLLSESAVDIGPAAHIIARQEAARAATATIESQRGLGSPLSGNVP